MLVGDVMRVVIGLSIFAGLVGWGLVWLLQATGVMSGGLFQP